MNELLKILDREFPDPKPSLRHRNAFELLISTILSAQCTDARVNTITPKLFPRDCPCLPEDILALGEEKCAKLFARPVTSTVKPKPSWAAALL